jgi:putative glutamine amidotransferase
MTAGPICASRDHPLLHRSRPIIGVTGPDEGGGAAWAFTRLAIWRAGGHAVRITPKRPRTIDHLDGLILGGGADVDPCLYGQDPTPVLQTRRSPGETWSLFLLGLLLFPLTWLARKLAGQSSAAHRGADPDRDKLELTLLDSAIGRGLPVLGICRGEQLINVYFGGTLHQDLTGFYAEDPEVRTILPRKRVDVAANSRLAKVVRRCGLDRVNALHRQAIDRLGRGLRVAARDRNGIVQAIEHADRPFVLGVQWHPEYLPQLPSQRALFDAFLRAAKAANAPAAPELAGKDVPVEETESLPSTFRNVSDWYSASMN